LLCFAAARLTDSIKEFQNAKATVLDLGKVVASCWYLGGKLGVNQLHQVEWAGMVHLCVQVKILYTLIFVVSSTGCNASSIQSIIPVCLCFLAVCIWELSL